MAQTTTTLNFAAERSKKNPVRKYLRTGSEWVERAAEKNDEGEEEKEKGTEFSGQRP